MKKGCRGRLEPILILWVLLAVVVPCGPAWASMEGDPEAPYLNEVLGDFYREDVVEYLSDQELEGKDSYMGTPFSRNAAGRPAGMSHFHPDNTMVAGDGGAMNCTGFVALVLKHLGADLDLLVPDHGRYQQAEISNLSRWVDFIVKEKGARAYLFHSKDDLLASGLAERGDLILMEPVSWSYKMADNHIGFFWGQHSFQDLFWHSDVLGNRISPIEKKAPQVYYYLIPLSSDPQPRPKTTMADERQESEDMETIDRLAQTLHHLKQGQVDRTFRTFFESLTADLASLRSS